MRKCGQQQLSNCLVSCPLQWLPSETWGTSPERIQPQSRVTGRIPNFQRFLLVIAAIQLILPPSPCCTQSGLSQSPMILARHPCGELQYWMWQRPKPFPGLHDSRKLSIPTLCTAWPTSGCPVRWWLQCILHLQPMYFQSPS